MHKDSSTHCSATVQERTVFQPEEQMDAEGPQGAQSNTNSPADNERGISPLERLKNKIGSMVTTKTMTEL
jgi:hypothetical protein